MPILPITATFAIAAAVALVLLSLPVSMRRMKTGVTAGDGGDQALARRVRAQGNFVEYAPLALITLGLAEANGVGSTPLWGLGAALAAGRASHAAGMLRGSTPLRGVGMILTYVALLGAAGALTMRLYG